MPEITIYDVITKKKETTKKADTKLIMKAYNLANSKHEGQKRSSRRTLYNTPFKCCVYFSIYWVR